MANYIYNSINLVLVQLSCCKAGLTSAPVPACGYSMAGEPFGACLYSGYSTIAESFFDAAFSFCVFTQENNRLSKTLIVDIIIS